MDKEIRIPLSALLLLAAGIVIGIAVMLLLPRTDPNATQKTAAAPATEESVATQQAAETQHADTAPSVSASDPAPPPVNTAALAPPPVSMNATIAGRHMEYSESTSGYPIAVGRRAVDSTPEGFVTSGNAVLLDENGAIMNPEPRSLGRNGLVGNPAVDPPSSRGAAYGRAYDWQ